MNQPKYALVTPARNEEVYIGWTIDAVVSQSVLPQKWVIVSDGSTDRTDEIVAEYARKYSFIRLVRAGEPAKKGQKDFGAKVRAFRTGYGQLAGVDYAFVGNLDADITFGPDYYEKILDRFRDNAELGVAGGIILEPYKNRFVPQRTSLNSVCGSVQLFRRECYESFGGYVPISRGGIDAAAEIMARSKGWAVRTFPEIEVYARRPVLTGTTSVFHTRFRQGISNYQLGYHPLFQAASCLFRIMDRPRVIGSAYLMLGYAWAWITSLDRALSRDVVEFLRSEQMGRLTPQSRVDKSGGRPLRRTN